MYRALVYFTLISLTIFALVYSYLILELYSRIKNTRKKILLNLITYGLIVIVLVIFGLALFYTFGQDTVMVLFFLNFIGIIVIIMKIVFSGKEKYSDDERTKLWKMFSTAKEFGLGENELNKNEVE